MNRLEKEEGTCEVGIGMVWGFVNREGNEFSAFLFFSFPFFF